MFARVITIDITFVSGNVHDTTFDPYGHLVEPIFPTSFLYDLSLVPRTFPASVCHWQHEKYFQALSIDFMLQATPAEWGGLGTRLGECWVAGVQTMGRTVHWDDPHPKPLPSLCCLAI